MRFGFASGCTAMLVTALFSQGLAAQSLRDWDGNAENDVLAKAAITIPLGAAPRSHESKPRLELSFETQRMGAPRSVTSLRFDPNFNRQTLQAAKFALTLEHKPRLLLNGERVATFGPRLTADEVEGNGGGLGVAGGVLIGLGAAIGGGFLIAQVVEDDLEDAFRGED